MHATVPWDATIAEAIMQTEIACAIAFYGQDGEGATAMLPILHALQHTFGFVPSDAVPLIASRLNVSKADVRGVISFYHDFRDAPVGRHELKLCRAEACQAVGVEHVAAHLEATHQLRPGTTSRGVTLHTVYCLGNCALGPAALIDGELVAGFDVAAADAVMARIGDSD